MRPYEPKEAHDAWVRGEVAIVDCREEDEHAATRIPGVPLVPMSEVLERLEDLPADRPLVFVCRSGARSGRLAEWLEATGEREDVGNLEGGIIGWAAEGLPYEGEPPR